MIGSVLLAVLVAAIVLFITFGPILRRSETPVVIDPDALAEPSGRLDFRHPRPSDLDALDALYADPVSAAANFWDADAIARSIAMLHNTEQFAGWARMSLVATLAGTDDLVGLATLAIVDTGSDHNGLSIGLQVAPEHRGKGLATEVLAAMIASTKDLTDSEIWIGTSIANHTVRHMMDTLGYEPQATTGLFQAPDGTMVESYWYQVGRDAPLPRFP